MADWTVYDERLRKLVKDIWVRVIRRSEWDGPLFSSVKNRSWGEMNLKET